MTEESNSRLSKTNYNNYTVQYYKRSRIMDNRTMINKLIIEENRIKYWRRLNHRTHTEQTT